MTTSGAAFYLPAVAIVAPVDTTGIGLVYNPNHRVEADGLLLKQFDDSAKLHALVRALVGPLQDVERAAFQVQEAFDVELSRGAQLDVLGGLVGVARDAQNDVAYRAYVKAAILGYASDGAQSTLYRIARVMLGAAPRVLIRPGWQEWSIPAHYDVEVTATALRFPWDTASLVLPERVAAILADALFLATSVGISLTLFYQYDPDADTFTFSSVGDAEEDSVTQGFADTSEGDTMGGTLIGAEERY